MKLLTLHVKLSLAILSIFLSHSAFSAPFETCPSKAFLFQANPTQVYGVNLVSGTNEVLQSDVGTLPGESGAGNVNGVGFDDYVAEDGTSYRYIIGFNTTYESFVRVDSDFKQTLLSVSNQPSGTFYVGDVYNHHYYFYRKNKGFYKMNLDSAANDYLDVQTITNTANRNFTDFSFHPRTEKLYGVDNNSGVLYVVDKDTGHTQGLGTTGEKGTFGAGYFDVDGYFYVSRNQDGKIYRIDLSTIDLPGDTPPYAAVEFAQGPLSGQNDGARCANAPLIDISEEPSTIDFGDAPDSYSSSLAANGPRHEIVEGGPYLGSVSPDGEVDAKLGASSDDSNSDAGNTDDEDGVGFVTGLARGLDNVVVVTASEAGYLQAWFDWNRDGDFADSDEQMFLDEQLVSGSNNLLVRVPIGADIGSSWARFRFGSQTGLSYSGGATDGEVEDHSIEISDVGTSYSYYPASGGWVTLAYEDLWPMEGDYDMNDVVFHYRTVTVMRESKLQRVDVYGQLVAIGASYHNGFAIRVPGVQASAVDTSKMRFRYAIDGLAGIEQVNSPIEAESDELIAIISQDVWQLVDTNCTFYRTDDDCQDDIQFEFELSLPFTELQEASTIGTLYDPFIFASENRFHGSVFNGFPGRNLEIHLADISPTEQANTSYFGLEQDASNIAGSRYYKNANNLPWSMEVGTSWKHPRSGKDLLEAYPFFENYVTSNKEDNSDWYIPENGNSNKVYD